jgi:carboxylesterase type B
MRALDAATVARAGQTKPLLLVTNGLFPETWPNIDGYIFTRQPAEEVGRGRNRNVTLLVGSTRDDGDLFNKRIESESEFFETFDQVFAFGLSEGTIEPEQFALARERYRPSRFGSDPQRALNAFAGDLLFNCTSLAFAESAASARRRRAPVYFYQFTHPLLSRNFEPVPDFHTVDASFWFDALSYIRFFFGIRIGPVDREMRDVMYRVFADFVHGVMPDPEFWPPLTPHDSEATDKILLENGLRSPLVSSIREGRCEFLREIGLLPDLPE